MAAEESRPSDPLGDKMIELIKRQKIASDEYTQLLTKKVGCSCSRQFHAPLPCAPAG